MQINRANRSLVVVATLVLLGTASVGNASAAPVDTSDPGYTDAASDPLPPDEGSGKLNPSDDGAAGVTSARPVAEQTLIDGTNPAFPEDSTQARAETARGLNHNRTLEAKRYRVIDPPSSRPANIGAYNKSYVKVPFLETKADFVHSYARTTWFGVRVPTKTTVSHLWAVSGVNISVSVPAGITAGPGGNTASDSTSAARKDVRSDLQQTVHFGGLAITKVRHSAVGKFQFGGSAYSVDSSDASVV